MTVGELRRKLSAWQGVTGWSAAMLVLVQTANGAWYMPQLSFFPVYLQEQLGLTSVAIGSIVAAAQVASMVTALLGGMIAGRLGSKWALVCGLVLAGVGALAFLSAGPWLVTALWLAGGAGLALITVGGASYLTRLSARGSLGMLAAVYALSMTVGGAIGNPVAGRIIERHGFRAFGLFEIALITATTLLAAFLMAYLKDRSAHPVSVRLFWSAALPVAREARVRLLLGLRCLPTIFYGMLTVLVPLLINSLSGSKATVAAYGTASLVVASAAQLLAGRAADRWGGRIPTLVAYAVIVLAGLGLAATAQTVTGLMIFGVLGVAAAWALSALMYVWVADGIAQPEHASTFGLLHAVWSLSMITGSLLGGWLVRSLAGLPFLVAGLLNIGALFLTLTYYGGIDAQRPGREPRKA